MKAISPCLWFDGVAEEAAEFYTSIFPESEITSVMRYGPNTPGPEGEVMLVQFVLRGQEFGALNGGPQFPHTEAVSFVVPCETADEVDSYWERLVDGGEPGPCGWLKDRFGVSWQIVPVELQEWMADPDPEKAQRITQAVLTTHGKLDVRALQKAYEGG
jgi:predicted 3-demethylubiquinone-9 3-methyltransferase (glyoxalase superfamily)